MIYFFAEVKEKYFQCILLSFDIVQHGNGQDTTLMMSHSLRCVALLLPCLSQPVPLPSPFIYV